MAKILILAEKPSVGKEIARVMGCRKNGDGFIEGDRYIITWALGHLVELASPDAYDKKYEHWNLLDLPMLPEHMKLSVIKQSGRQFRAVQSLMKRGDVSELVIATDSGREGELVARWIMMKSGWKKPAKRLWISSQTDKAIKDGFNNLKPASQYDNLFRSAQARAEADWIVGLNVTRALTCKFGAQLSAGRVQTPTLALIVDREEEIKKFVPKEYYTVTVKTPDFTATWRDGKGNARIFDREKAEALAAAVRGKTGILTNVTKSYKHTPPPPAYDLTELQRDANRRYAYSAKETLSLMQSLYEHHKILTYPRTDSRYISDDVVPTLPDRLRSVAVDQYRDLANSIMRSRPLQTKYLVNNAKVTDHHAIIPTEEYAELHRFSGPERNIFDLVVRRFFAVLMPAVEYDEIKLTLTIGGERFSAKGKVIKNQGWKAAYDRSSSFDDDDEGDSDERDQSLPPLNQGASVKVLDAKVYAGQTAPPKRYTEATLLTAMEHPVSQIKDREQSKILQETGGLGTPATRADIIEKLFSSFYVERRGKELAPTSKGTQIVGIVPAELRSAELTAKWEKQLANIAAGTTKDSAFVAEMRKYASQLVTRVKNSEAVYKHDNLTREKCPDCGKFLLSVQGKRGKMVVCQDRECGYRRSLTQVSNARCPNCHKKLELRGEGDDAMFACVCGYREKLSKFKERKASSGAGKADVRRYMEQQKQQEAKDKGSSALADQLSKWLENN